MGRKQAALLAALLSGASAARRFNRPADGVYDTSARRKTGAGVINVHFIAHTHDDVGWLKNVDEYYYGAHNDIQRAVVQSIISNVVTELAANPDRKFIYVEQAFFQRWWAEQTPATQTVTKQLVASGQLEFINGGWCMHDEANPSFVDMIDQTTLGHRFLTQEFGVSPKATWQIDPFGHSAFQASMMSGPISGYSSVFWARSDHQDSQARDAVRKEEFIWAPSPTNGLNGATYGGLLWGSYCTPGGLDWEGNDSPVRDDASLEDYNVDDFIALLLNIAGQNNSTRPQGNQNDEVDVLFPIGCDFQYERAHTVFNNLDKVIHYLSQDGRLNAFYSTPSAYAAAKLEKGKTYSLNSYDMMPYSDGDHSYWTGYFVSRSALKAYVRESSSVFQAAKLAQVFAGGAPDVSPANPLYRFERSMGVLQHHDAVAGTAKQAVSNDYARRLAWGREDGDALFSSAFNRLAGTPNSTYAWASCDLANVTICPALEAGVPTALIVFNSQAQTVGAAPVRVPVGFPAGVASYAVTGPTGAAVTAQLLPLSPADSHLRTAYYNYTSTVSVQWLAFQASLPPAGFATYFFTPAASAKEAAHTHASEVTVHRVGSASRDSVLTNGVLSLTFDGPSGALKAYANAQTGVSSPIAQNLMYYRSFPGTQKDGQASGAYIFRPNTSDLTLVADGAIAVTTITGPVVSEARQTYASWASQVTRLWAGASAAELEYTIGPIPFDDGWGKEIITRYDTPLVTNATWYSDSNVRDTMTRVRNYRPTWNYTITEPVAGNYVPVNGFTYLRDVNTGSTMSIVTDRSQGGASIADGSLEVMIQRRLQHDDGRGVGEPLNETGLDGSGLIVRTTHRLTFDAKATAASSRRGLVADALYRPVTRFAPLPSGVTPASWLSAYKPTFSGVSAALPPQLHLLTAHSWGPTTLLLRLSHSYEGGEDPVLSQPASVDLATLLPGVALKDCTETTLSGNQPLASAPQWTYAVEANGPSVTLPVVPAPPAGNGMTVTLGPLAIRTFMCTTAPQDAAWTEEGPIRAQPWAAPAAAA